jgi:uncharacterized RDD family membrane protein YckC
VNCPSCRHGLPAGHNEACPFCGTRLSAPIEGALATDPHLVTPNPPIREIPGLRKKERERTWKDEVRERVRERRERRSEGLPLFPEDDEADGAALEADAEGLPAEASGLAADDTPHPHEPGAEIDDLVFRSEPEAGSEPEPPGPPLRGLTLESAAPRSWSLGESRPMAEPALQVDAPAPTAASDAPPVERPAMPFERLLAAVVDLSVLITMWAAVVYFASRVARVPLSGLWSAWPWMALYLGALGLLYAGYFTGTTGQTLGKMVHRLHVLDVSGGPPGHVRALLRALLGAAGVVLAGGGLLPMLFDPARRALHDRLLRTRVIRL